jgi:hypothetical protein
LQGRDQRRASDAQAQIEADEREREKKKQALAMLLMKRQIEQTSANTERLRRPEPVKLPSQFELDGILREYVTEGASDQVVLSRFQKTHKDIPVSMARAGLARIRESEASSRRSQEAAERAARAEQRAIANAEGGGEASFSRQRQQARSIATVYRNQAKSFLASNPEMMETLYFAAIAGIRQSFPALTPVEAGALVQDVFMEDPELGWPRPQREGR